MEFVKLRRLQFVQDYSPHSNRYVYYEQHRLCSIGNTTWGRISPPRNPSSGWISIKKSKSGFQRFPFYRSIGKSKKKICNTILVNSSLLFADYAWACKTAVLRDSFSIPFSDFPIAWKKGNPKTDISALKSTPRFRVWLQIRNPDFKI